MELAGLEERRWCASTTVNTYTIESIQDFFDQVGHETIYYLLQVSIFSLNQGLLYLDGRNSQKYLHQDQADF